MSCSGFLILVPHDYISIRIFVALIVSIPILVVTAFLRPFKNPEDNALALFSQTILVLAYLFCAVIRIINSSILSEEHVTALLGFKQVTGAFWALWTICLSFLITLFSAYAKAIRKEYKRLIRFEEDDSSAWILGVAALFSVAGLMSGMAAGGVTGGFVGAPLGFLIGCASGSVIYSRYVDQPWSSFRKGKPEHVSTQSSCSTLITDERLHAIATTTTETSTGPDHGPDGPKVEVSCA